ncbi:MAG: hypothetical protein ABI036_04430 [Fibrobacteria bacterium]
MVFPQAYAATTMPTYGYAPTETSAGADFRITLSPLAFDCNTEFKVIGAAANDSSITLSFVHAQRAQPLDCKVVLMLPPTLEFKVPALRAGKYKVYAMAYPECAYNTDPKGPVCKIAVIPELIGSLTANKESKPDEAWHVRPTKTPAGKAFDFAVVTSRYGNCQTSFYGQSIQVDADKRIIHLSFGVEQNTGIVCIQDMRPYGPTFSAPALKAGNYQVLVYELPDCAIPKEPNGPVCLIAVQPVAAAESLSVSNEGDPFRYGWFAQPASVKPNVDFTLSILSYSYHPCAYNFTHPSLVIEGNKIIARFAIESSGADICTADIRAGGPSFAVKGLAPGEYQIFVATPPTCLFLPQPCEIAEPAPALFDTLQVLSVSPTSLSHREVRAGKSSDAGYSSWQGRMGFEAGKRHDHRRNLMGRRLR